ncbi:site-specific integrase [Actinacidiphila acidipaludis]|uniref:Site-specific integrase n=1 Tax=Actinacidiphila acidipaludis TaxID=2873382 RepID=A0ABS7QJK2_9ACTN|nr:site-specific integrase [Streptomyces acidipaludis]MBY8882976.1 site-specific integrase [Streptomyces acidipaludis]
MVQISCRAGRTRRGCAAGAQAGQDRHEGHAGAVRDDQCAALLKACQGRDLRDVRDMAIVRFMLEARAGEVANLMVADVSLAAGTAVIRRTKTGRPRTVPFGARTTASIDRYLRARRSHRLASTPGLWLARLAPRRDRLG